MISLLFGLMFLIVFLPLEIFLVNVVVKVFVIVLAAKILKGILI